MEESYHGFVNEGLPEFVGEDPFGWIIKAERFFQEQKIHYSDRVQRAFMRMEGVAMLWFQSWCQDNYDANRTTFSIDLMRRFNAKIQKPILEKPEPQFEPCMEKESRKEFGLEEIEATSVDRGETDRREFSLMCGEESPDNVSALGSEKIVGAIAVKMNEETWVSDGETRTRRMSHKAARKDEGYWCRLEDNSVFQDGDNNWFLYLSLKSSHQVDPKCCPVCIKVVLTPGLEPEHSNTIHSHECPLHSIRIMNFLLQKEPFCLDDPPKGFHLLNLPDLSAVAAISTTGLVIRPNGTVLPLFCYTTAFFLPLLAVCHLTVVLFQFSFP
ncbi:hypothetical protein TSUD_138460 [Trifolium subterraneum]|uniref:Retrotransposon gag domain-containing protein n=1 Tax=Trifolium subterraneum TaxID=3900 RepID=A0A2Z6LTR9_TRISU|nr:hypothetical protein TSUD_138460 [Trifolium subterraneum]